MMTFFHCFSLIFHSLPLTIKERVQPGVPRLTCAPATTVVSACPQKKVTKSTLTANSCIWAAHVREDTQEDSVIATLMPAR